MASECSNARVQHLGDQRRSHRILLKMEAVTRREPGRTKGIENPTLTLTLHEDLTVEILLRLPVRSLLRFKCVCKSWLSLISDPQFAKSHFDLAAAPTHRFLLPTKSAIESLDVDASLDEDSSLVQLDLKVPYTDDDFHDIIWGSCRGFILLAGPGFLIVWNPSMGTRRQIPLSQMQISECLSGLIDWGAFFIGKGFGYDESRDDYAIVLVGLDRDQPLTYDWFPRAEVFSLKTNTSYFISAGGNEAVYECTQAGWTTGLFLNHSLHWLVKSKENGLPLILAFNLIYRSLSEILLPHETLELPVKYLNVIGGCLSLCSLDGVQMPDMPTIWVMKEYGVHSSWTKSFVLPLDNYPYNCFIPICFTKGGDIFGTSFCGRLIKFNDKGELIECREHRACHGKYGLLMHNNIYRESLLSLPGDFAEDEEEASENEEAAEDEEEAEDD